MTFHTGLRRKAGALALGASLAMSLVVATASATYADEDPALTRLQQQGFARIAIANEPPWTSVSSDGKVSGAGPDVARAVLQKLGVKDIVASISEYGAMIPGLQAHRFDMVSAGLFIKPQRCAAVLFSEPDLCDAESFMVKKGNPMKLMSYADIAANHAKVGVVGGGTEEKLAIGAGVPRADVIVAPDGLSGVKMLQDGRIDVFALPILSISSLMKQANDPNLEMYAPVKNTPIYCAGVAFPKQDRALRDAYDKVLAEMKADGSFAKIVEPYGYSAAAAMQTTREKLCGGPN